MTSHVEEQIKARIAAARRRTEDMRRQRAELAAARKHGLAQRHAQKLRNQASVGQTDGSATESGSAATAARESNSPANDTELANLHGSDGNAGVAQTDTTDPSRSDTATGDDGLPRRAGDHVIAPIPWCSCGGALGIAPGRVTGFEYNGDPVIQLDLSGCSTRPAPPHCTLPPLVFTRREIEELRSLL